MCFEKEYLKCEIKCLYHKSAFLMHKLRYKHFLMNPLADCTPQGYVSAFYVFIYIYSYVSLCITCSFRSMGSDILLHKRIIHGHLPTSVCS